MKEKLNKILEDMTKPKKNYIEENVDILEQFIADNSDMSDELIVSLVVFERTGGLVYEGVEKELRLYKLIDEKSEITEKGKEIVVEKQLKFQNDLCERLKSIDEEEMKVLENSIINVNRILLKLKK